MLLFLNNEIIIDLSTTTIKNVDKNKSRTINYPIRKKIFDLGILSSYLTKKNTQETLKSE